MQASLFGYMQFHLLKVGVLRKLLLYFSMAYVIPYTMNVAVCSHVQMKSGDLGGFVFDVRERTIDMSPLEYYPLSGWYIS